MLSLRRTVPSRSLFRPTTPPGGIAKSRLPCVSRSSPPEPFQTGRCYETFQGVAPSSVSSEDRRRWFREDRYISYIMLREERTKKRSSSPLRVALNPLHRRPPRKNSGTSGCHSSEDSVHDSDDTQTSGGEEQDSAVAALQRK